jgi:hypothetical protein
VIHFTEDGHKYTTDSGKELLSVTQILKIVGLVPDYPQNGAAHRGTAVHAAIEYHIAGDLDEEALDPAILPYLDGWKLFEAEMSPTIGLVEAVVGVESEGWAGKVDLIMSIDGKHGVMDIKTGSAAPWHRLQLSGYARGANTPDAARWNLYLPGDGKYKLVQHNNTKRDMAAWDAAATLALWKERNMK